MHCIAIPCLVLLLPLSANLRLWFLMNSTVSGPVDIPHLYVPFRAKCIVAETDKLLLTILYSLEDSDENNPTILFTSENKYLRFMLVNQQWCKLAQGFIWKHLSHPQQAFSAVLRQFDVPIAGSHEVTEKVRTSSFVCSL